MSRLFGRGRYATGAYPERAQAGGSGGGLTPPANPGDNGDVALALNGDLVYLAGGAPGDVLTWNGTAWISSSGGGGGLNPPANPGDDGKVAIASAGNLVYAFLVDANVSASAAIAGTKISPNFGAQNILTTGTLGAGATTVGTLSAAATTVTTLTASSLGLGVVHSSAGGVFTSSAIVNADVSAGAAIAVSKLAPGTNGQVLQTSGGTPVWGLVPGASLTPGAANTVLTTNSGATATAFTLLVNANVDAAAAIAGTKIAPDFGSQNVVTTGTLGAGATTVTGLTVSSLGLGVVHSSAGGVFTSSTIVNADVNAAAAITVTKLAPGTNGQVLQTSGGTPVWALVPGGSISPGAANTVFVTDSGATAAGFALLVNANVDAAAAIAGTKISPNFGAQDVTTTGGYIGNSGTSFIRLGLASGTGSGGAAAASAGNIRVARGNPGFLMLGRNNTDTGDVTIISYQSTATSTTQFGGIGAVNTNIVALTQVELLLSATSKVTVTANDTTVKTANLHLGTTGLTAVTFDCDPSNVANQAAVQMIVGGQQVTGTGTIAGGHLTVQAGGGANGSATNITGGLLLLHGGDVNNASTTNVAGHVGIRGGTASGTGAVAGNVWFHAAPASFQSMQNGTFFGNGTVAPAGNPTSGYFLYANAAGLFGRSPSGAVTMLLPP